MISNGHPHPRLPPSKGEGVGFDPGDTLPFSFPEGVRKLMKHSLVDSCARSLAPRVDRNVNRFFAGNLLADQAEGEIRFPERHFVGQ